MPFFGAQPQNLLPAIFDNIGIAIAVVDSRGAFVFANKTALGIFGDERPLNSIPLADWVRRYRFQYEDGRDVPLQESGIMRALAGESVEPRDLRVTLPDGRIKWLHTSAHKFSVMGIAGVLSTISDETEQVELRQAAVQVEHARALEMLTRGLAHDFNNVLSMITANAELALFEPNLPESVSIHLQQIVCACAKTRELGKRFMRFSRIDDQEIRPLQINALIDEVAQLVRPILAAKIDLNMDLQPGLPEINAIAGQIEQVLINLILNAVDAMPHGGHLKLSTAISQDKDEGSGQMILISVEDTGAGIAENLKERVFEPFFTTKPAGKGTGLGLPSAQMIVNRYGGRIEVQSISEGGTKFTVYLSVGKRPPPAQAAA